MRNIMTWFNDFKDKTKRSREKEKEPEKNVIDTDAVKFLI